GAPAWSRVAAGVYVGRRPRRGEIARLGVAAVLDLTAEAPAPPLPPSVTYANVPILDLVAPSREQLDRAVAFVREHESRGVYVHCALGRSRAPAVAAAYARATEARP